MNLNRFIVIACLFIVNTKASDLRNMPIDELKRKMPEGFDVYKYRGLYPHRIGGQTFSAVQPVSQTTGKSSNQDDNENEK